MARNFRILFVTTFVIAAGAAAWWFVGRTGPAPGPVASGGRLVATFRSEPATFNRLVSPHVAEELVARLTQARLVRFNRATREVEPRLARSWTRSPDGLTWTLTLREGVRFSDGEPFTSADVLFSFQALHDERVASPIASSVLVDGRPLLVRAIDANTVVVTFPAPHGAGLELLDAVPILPRHKLAAALAAGTFSDAWSLQAPLAEIVGLGPFVIAAYDPGQRLVFRRNPHFWKQDDAGRRLPYLDEIELQIVPDRNTEMLRLRAGDVDLTTDEIRAEDYASMRRLEEQGTITLASAGATISPLALWFNLASKALAADRPWLVSEPFRRAVSHAVDRDAIVDTVYLGAAVPVFGPITPGHGDWFLADLPRAPYDPAQARALLASVGLRDPDGDGMLDDSRGRPARFSVLTARGDASRERTAALLQEHLRRIGLTVDVVALEAGAMYGQWTNRDYDTMFFYAAFSSFEPALDFWMSSGSFHFWNANQPSPATEWEEAIDDLMRRQSATLDAAERRRLFAQAQRTLADHLPILYFTAPEITIAMSARVRGATPSVLQPPVLWNAEVLSLASDGAPVSRR